MIHRTPSKTTADNDLVGYITYRFINDHELRYKTESTGLFTRCGDKTDTSTLTAAQENNDTISDVTQNTHRPREKHTMDRYQHSNTKTAIETAVIFRDPLGGRSRNGSRWLPGDGDGHPVHPGHERQRTPSPYHAGGGVVRSSTSCSETDAEDPARTSVPILPFFVRDERCWCTWIMCRCLRAGSLKCSSQ